MTEFIINSEQLERIIEAIEHNTGREVNRVVIDGERTPEIVRCKDCARYEVSTVDEDGEGDPSWCWKWQHECVAEDGYCAWGERRSDANE